jgi:transposase-like protein
MSDFKGRRFPTDIILVCVRWYCKYGVSYLRLRPSNLRRAKFWQGALGV